MTAESIKKECVHDFQLLEGKKGPNGEWVLCCRKCGELKYSEPPRKPTNESANQKPLLME